MPGVITSKIGTLSGRISYIEFNTNDPLVTVDCSTLNVNVFIMFYSAFTPSGTYTLSNIQDNQTITLKNWTTNSTPVPIAFSTYSLYGFGIDNGSTPATGISLARGNSIVIQRISGKLYQVTPNGNFPLGISTTTMSATTSLTSPLITGSTSVTTPSLTSTAGLSIGTTGSTSITMGASGIATTLNSDLTMGSNKSVFTTSAQQMRLGYPNTVATAPLITSSLGPFFKSFGPASMTSSTYTIPYEGANGLFTATGLDGCGGLLTITIKNTDFKFATYVYSMCKRNGLTGFQALQAISINTGGWSGATPSVGAGLANGLLLTFNATADWTGAFVSWMFLGSS
jgi:hypothetical protein